MVDKNDQVLYAGKSKNLRTRLNSYLRAKEVSEKGYRILHHTAFLLWEELPDEFGCLLREVELIELLRPKYNVRDNPNRTRLGYLCFGRRPAPHFHVSTHRSEDAIRALGPLFLSRRLKAAVALLNDFYRLRDCPKKTKLVFSDQGQLWSRSIRPLCIRADIQRCLGPCGARCSMRKYDEHATAALQFFENDGEEVLAHYQSKLDQLIEELQFERAALVQEDISLLEWLQEGISQSRENETSLSFVYEVTGNGPCPHWYIIHRGKVLSVVPANESSASTELLEALAKGRTPLHVAHAHQNISLVSSWFRKHPNERDSTFSFQKALQRMKRRIEGMSSETLPLCSA